MRARIRMRGHGGTDDKFALPSGVGYHGVSAGKGRDIHLEDLVISTNNLT